MTLSELCKEVLELDKKATPGPFIVERVDHEEAITYEVSRDEINPSFHVIFAEYHSDAAKAKHNAYFYAHARNNYAKLALAAQRMKEALTTLMEHIERPIMYQERENARTDYATALADVQKIVEGE